jgi:hypothetical protein
VDSRYMETEMSLMMSICQTIAHGGEEKKSLTAGISSVTLPPMCQRSVIAEVGGAANAVGFVLQITSAENVSQSQPCKGVPTTTSFCGEHETLVSHTYYNSC